MLIAQISVTLKNFTNNSQTIFQANWLEHTFKNISLENILQMMIHHNGSNFLSALNTTSSLAPGFIENVNKTLNQNSTIMTFNITTKSSSFTDNLAALQMLTIFLSVIVNKIFQH